MFLEKSLIFLSELAQNSNLILYNYSSKIKTYLFSKLTKLEGLCRTLIKHAVLSIPRGVPTYNMKADYLHVQLIEYEYYIYCRCFASQEPLICWELQYHFWKLLLFAITYDEYKIKAYL